MEIKSVIKIRGVNPYILVTSDQASRIKSNWKRPLPVAVQIDGKPETPWRINMMPTGDGNFYLYLRGEVRKASGTKVGDHVTARIVYDSEYGNGPQHPMPEWFNAYIEKDQTAKGNWQRLSPSRKKEVLRYLANLKSTDAKERNMKRALEVLSGKKGRFLGRTWINGS